MPETRPVPSTIPELLQRLELAVSDAQDMTIRLDRVADMLDGPQSQVPQAGGPDFCGGVDVRSRLTDLLASLTDQQAQARGSLSRLERMLEGSIGRTGQDMREAAQVSLVSRVLR